MTDSQFQDFIGLVRERASQFKRKVCGLEFEDLEQEGWLLFIHKVLPNFDEANDTKLSTYFYSALTHKFMSLTSYHSRRICEALNPAIAAPVEKLSIYLRLELSEKSLEVIHLLLEESVELYGEGIKEIPKPTLGLIRNALRNRGWTHKDIASSFKEIKGALASL